MKLHPKVEELKLRAKPISYSTVGVNQLGQLSERTSLLDQRIVEGYGCIWGQRNSHGEIFVRGCFAKSISELGPKANSNYSIKLRDEHGRSCALFEILIEDEIGLYFKTKPLDEVQWCDDLLIQLRSGTINNFSNGFRPVWDKIEYNAEKDALMMFEAKLFEISAVSIPSDLETFAIRSMEEDTALYENIEDFILDLPRSKQLDARKLFTRSMTLKDNEPFKLDKRTLPIYEPSKNEVDYEYLLTNLKLF